ncbi:MAG: hypothetical protein ABIQ79_01315 [Nitrospiraceae bacterium]
MRTGFGYAEHEKLKSVPDAQQYLNVGVTVEQLDPLASRLSDNEADLALHHARRTLFQTISPACRTWACAQPARQHDGAWVNPTEAEQGSGIQTHRPSFRLIFGLEHTGWRDSHDGAVHSTTSHHGRARRCQIARHLQ